MPRRLWLVVMRKEPEHAARTLRIGVDFDGVLFDHVPYLLRGFRDAHGIDLNDEGFRHWDFFQYRAVREKNLSWQCVNAVLERIETDPILHREPPRDPLSVPVLREWRHQGHEIDVVTARGDIARESTELFLRHHNVPHDRLRMGVAIKTGYDVLIDDAPHNVLMAAASGGVALLMDHPYNRDVPSHNNPRRVRDWHEVDRLVGRISRHPRSASPVNLASPPSILVQTRARTATKPSSRGRVWPAPAPLPARRVFHGT